MSFESAGIPEDRAQIDATMKNGTPKTKKSSFQIQARLALWALASGWGLAASVALGAFGLFLFFHPSTALETLAAAETDAAVPSTIPTISAVVMLRLLFWLFAILASAAALLLHLATRQPPTQPGGNP